MHVLSPLSPDARSILDRMEPDRCYNTSNLRALVPDASAELFREVMHELWVNRQVERVGASEWRRHRSTLAPERPVEPQTTVVKPEDLFDHGTFADFFR